MLDGSVRMMLGDSLLLSGIGMLVVFLELVLLAGMILLVSKIIRGLSAKESPVVAAVTPAAPVAVAAPAPAVAIKAPACAPALTLTDVSAPCAAAVMAIVSNQSGVPLNRLVFHSIKGVIALTGVEDREAAAVMALTAHQMQMPLNQLCFKSIKKV